ncbi:MAG: serine hydrolase domain-containing protein, partial [Bacteroidota bacterium]
MIATSTPLPKTLLLGLLLLGSWLQAQTERFDQITQSLRGDLIEAGAPLWKLTDRMRAESTPGVSIAVVDDFELVGAKAYGLIAADGSDQVNTETRFQAASISKLVNAVGVMRLVEEGKLNLDEDINKLLTSWQIPQSPKYPNAVITPRMLLSHMAGLSAHGFGGYSAADKMPEVVDILNKAKGVNSEKVRIILKPGSKVKYSGGGTTILQLLIEDLTGQSYEAYMQEAVFQPLG